MSQQLLHEMSFAELRSALAEHFPEQGSVVYLNIKYDCEVYGNPVWSADLKFGQSGVSCGGLIKIEYAERLGDLCDSIKLQLEQIELVQA